MCLGGSPSIRLVAEPSGGPRRILASRPGTTPRDVVTTLSVPVQEAARHARRRLRRCGCARLPDRGRASRRGAHIDMLQPPGCGGSTWPVMIANAEPSGYSRASAGPRASTSRSLDRIPPAGAGAGPPCSAGRPVASPGKVSDDPSRSGSGPRSGSRGRGACPGRRRTRGCARRQGRRWCRRCRGRPGPKPGHCDRRRTRRVPVSGHEALVRRRRPDDRSDLAIHVPVVALHPRLHERSHGRHRVGILELRPTRRSSAKGTRLQRPRTTAQRACRPPRCGAPSPPPNVRDHAQGFCLKRRRPRCGRAARGRAGGRSAAPEPASNRPAGGGGRCSCRPATPPARRPRTAPSRRPRRQQSSNTPPNRMNSPPPIRPTTSPSYTLSQPSSNSCRSSRKASATSSPRRSIRSASRCISTSAPALSGQHAPVGHRVVADAKVRQQCAVADQVGIAPDR